VSVSTETQLNLALMNTVHGVDHWTTEGRAAVAIVDLLTPLVPVPLCRHQKENIQTLTRSTKNLNVMKYVCTQIKRVPE